MRARGSEEDIETPEGRCHVFDYAEGRASEECRARKSGLEHRAVHDAPPRTSEQISGRIVRGGSTVGRSVRWVPEKAHREGGPGAGERGSCHAPGPGRTAGEQGQQPARDDSGAGRQELIYGRRGCRLGCLLNGHPRGNLPARRLERVAQLEPDALWGLTHSVWEFMMSDGCGDSQRVRMKDRFDKVPPC